MYNKEGIDPKRRQEILTFKDGPKVEVINLAQFKIKANMTALGSLKKEFEIIPSSKSKSMSINTAETYLGFKISTDSIKVIKDKGHTMYVFPVVLTSKRAISFQNLTIDQSDSGTVAFVNTYTPTKNWIANWKKGHKAKFDGEINVTYLRLDNRETTNSTGSLVKSERNGIAGAQNPVDIAVMPKCTTTTYYDEIPYSCASGNHYPGDPCYLTGDDRAGYRYFTYNITTCENENPGGGGGTTPTPPPAYDPCPTDPPTAPLVSNKKSLRNKVMVVPPSECDEEEPLPEVPPIKDIRNKTTEPCISTTVQEILAANKDIEGKLAEIIKNFDASKNVKINIFDGTTVNNRPGQTSNQTFIGNDYSANITLNTEYHANTSKENLVATLIHEIVHSYLGFSSNIF